MMIRKISEKNIHVEYLEKKKRNCIDHSSISMYIINYNDYVEKNYNVKKQKLVIKAWPTQ